MLPSISDTEYAGTLREHHYIFFLVSDRTGIPNMSQDFSCFRNINYKRRYQQSSTAFFLFLNYILDT
jgi:hypothetical protein